MPRRNTGAYEGEVYNEHGSMSMDLERTFTPPVTRTRTNRHRCVSFFNGLIFLGKNVVALSIGFLIGVAIRAYLGVLSKTDPVFFNDNNGTELAATDAMSCFTTLLLCHWTKQSGNSQQKNLCDASNTMTLLARGVVRNGIPFFLGLIAMFATKWVDGAINGSEHMVFGPNNSRLFEESDVIGLLVLVLSYHVVDRLLECCQWHTDPYYCEYESYGSFGSTTLDYR